MDTISKFLCVEIDVFAITVITIIFLYDHISRKRQLTQRAFHLLLFASIVLLLSDICMWFFEGMKFTGDRPLLEVSTFIFNIVALAIGSLWLVYCDCKLMSDENRQLRFLLYFVPWLLSLPLLIINMKIHFLYFYDPQNIYHRGPLYFIHVFLFLIYIVVSFITIIRAARKKSRLRRCDTYSLLLFGIPPVICAFIQILHYGITLIPPSISISLLIIFAQRQSSLITIDNLTGLNNHRAFEKYLFQKLYEHSEKGFFFLLMLDANNFKSINDTYGHAEGDAALIRIADVLRCACPQGDCLARLGGDEFVIAGLRKQKDDVEFLIQNIHCQIEKENLSQGSPYMLSMSIGCAIYDSAVHRSIDELMKVADDDMYRVKRESKSN